MTYLSSLSVTHFRNLTIADCPLSAGFNLLVGDNAAGKTSVLEAIYYLSTLKSFRTQTHNDLIAHFTERDKGCAVIRAGVHEEDHDFFMAMERCKDRFRLRLGREDLPRASLFVEHLPVLALHAQSDDLVLAGPEFRRKFIDRMAFYLFTDFVSVYAQFTRVLKQRNAALRTGQSTQTWDPLFVQYGERLNERRAAALDLLKAALPKVFEALAPHLSIEIQFHPGHKSGLDLSEALARNRARDQDMGQTMMGPQRADILFTLNDYSFKSSASRGQIKLFTAALTLATAQIWQVQRGKRAVLLFDDFMSEFDAHHSSGLLNYLSNMGHQVFISAVDRQQIDFPFDAVFRLDAGQIAAVV